jgi:hypothetical protein
MAIVQEVHMVSVLDGCVTAILAMNVTVICVGMCHGNSLSEEVKNQLASISLSQHSPRCKSHFRKNQKTHMRRIGNRVAGRALFTCLQIAGAEV